MSALNDVLDRYLTMRRGFGFKLTTQEIRLRTFVAFMVERGATTTPCAHIPVSAGCRQPHSPPNFPRNQAKTLRSPMAPRLGRLLQPCMMPTARLQPSLDENWGQRHCD